jgi:hypothetical protein
MRVIYLLGGTCNCLCVAYEADGVSRRFAMRCCIFIVSDEVRSAHHVWSGRPKKKPAVETGGLFESLEKLVLAAF